jgi:predicted Zn-dependent protease
MTFGDGPDRGYVRRGEFVHPRAGFRFSAPDGFMIRGTASAVIAWRRDGATLVLTSAAPGIAASPLDYLVDQWASDLALDQAGPITINSRPAASAQAFVQSDRGPLNAYLLVIGWSPSLVYRLALLIPPRSADRAAAVFWPAADSFEPLTPAQAALYPPLKLRVVTVTRRDTVASLASRMATTEPREERFRILNGLGAGDAVRPGQRVKIVE